MDELLPNLVNLIVQVGKQHLYSKNYTVTTRQPNFYIKKMLNVIHTKLYVSVNLYNKNLHLQWTLNCVGSMNKNYSFASQPESTQNHNHELDTGRQKQSGIKLQKLVTVSYGS